MGSDNNSNNSTANNSQNKKAELISSSEAAKKNFSTNNTLSGGCTECGCSALIYYHYDDGKPVPNAPFELTDSNNTKVTGKTDDKGLCLIEDMGCGSFDLLLEEGSDEFKAPETEINNPVLQANPEYAALAGEYFSLFVILQNKGYIVYDADDSNNNKVDVDDTSLFLNIPDEYEPAYERFWELNEQINDGSLALRQSVNKIHTSLPAEVSSDANDNSSILLFCEIALGFVPVVGQAMDLYDVGQWGWTTYSEEASRSDPLHWAMGTLAIIGFVPGLGDALKKTGKTIINALQKSDNKAIQKGIKALRSLSNGNVVTFLSGFASKIKEYGNKALDLLNQIIAGLKKALNNAAKSNWIVRLLKDGFDGMIKAMEMLSKKVDEMLDWVAKKVDEFIEKIFTKLSGTPRPKGTKDPLEPVNAGKADVNKNTTEVVQKKDKVKQHNNTAKTDKAEKCKGDPVDMATGNAVEWRTDFTLQGLVPLIHKRFYHSGQDKIPGLLGRTWRSNWDMTLTLTDGMVVFTDDKGGEAHYVLPDEGGSERAPHMPKWRLERLKGRLYMRHLDGTVYGFNHTGFNPILVDKSVGNSADKSVDSSADESANNSKDNNAAATRGKSTLLLTSISDANGNGLRFIYERTKLKWIHLGADLSANSSDKQQGIKVELHKGRIEALTLCDENKHPLKALARFSYNRAGQLVKVRGDAGKNFDYEYDHQDNLLRWSDLDKTWIEHTYDEQGRTLSTRGSDGRWQDQTRYDDANKVIFYKSPLKGIECFYRDERNNIVKHIDANGYVTVSIWQDNQLVSETNALGERTEYTYDDWGQVTKVIAPDGSEQQYTYNEDGLLTSVINPLGATWQYDYDAQGNLLKAQDPLGAAWHYGYNLKGQLISRTAPDGLSMAFSYTAQGQIESILPPLGHKIGFHYDTLGRLTERRTFVKGEAQPSASLNQEPFDGNKQEPSAGREPSTSFNKEPSAVFNKESSAAFNKEKQLVRRWKYQNTSPTPEKVIFEDGTEQRFEYDIEGNLTKVIDPLGQVYGYEYGAFDMLKVSTDPLGHRTLYMYNGDGQFSGVINSQKDQWRYGYNEAGQIIEERHFDGRKTQFAYDELGRVAKRTTPDGAQLRFYYDALGRLIQKQAFALAKPLNDKKAAKQTAQKTTQTAEKPRYIVASNTFFEYDDASQLIKATVDDSRRKRVSTVNSDSANKVVVEYEYDLSGRRIKETINGQVLSSEYDAAGERIGINSLERPLENDSLERSLENDSLEPSVINSPEPSLINSPYQVQLDYQQGLLNGVQISEHQALLFERNNQGLETFRSNGQGFDLAQEWSLGGDLLSQQLMGYQHEHHAQHSQHKQSQSQDPNSSFGGSRADLKGPIKPDSFQALQRSYQYDALARITEIDESHWGKSQFKHNANGQITHQKHEQPWTEAKASIKQFDYDEVQNLVAVNVLGSAHTSANTSAVASNNTANKNVIDFAAKRLEKQLKYQKGGRVERIGDHTYHYDLCGRVFEKVTNKKGFRPQVTRFEWDEEDRLIRATVPNGDTWFYQYDAFGRRVAKIKQQSGEAGSKRANQPEKIHYLWDGDNLIEQQRRYADGTLYDTTQWTYEPESFRPLAQRVIKETGAEQGSLPPQLHYIINDHAGSPRELCSEGGHVEWRGKQSLWGEFNSVSNTRLPERQYLEQAANDPVGCDIRYQGQVFDAETNLYYNRHRYYDPDSCQYLTPDPIGMAGGLRPSSYVDNPMEWVDPLGLAKCALGKLQERGYNGVKQNENMGLDYSESNALYVNSKKPDVNPIQTIEYTGNYHEDFKAANMAAFGQKSTPKDYVWHHVDDYDSATNKGTMQLVHKDAHRGIPHSGGVSQYKQATGNKYIFKTW
ncbi:RHS repeat-associated core domain-containing protein [uncultured Shewanella sp.]|uniref:RHS repeat-associated core domain-containing protein n=1 Tax=uncultured Shewanella sp. TaxID=173975 RepID=UPI002613BE67|nr:RHS repeat-associated core domain-containing protein [uncultured Shewanella sp.]